jgi:hypothetical protein
MSYGLDDRSFVTVQFHPADHADLVKLITRQRDEHAGAGRAREAARADVLLMMATAFATVHNAPPAVISPAPAHALTTVPDPIPARPSMLRRVRAMLRRARHAESAL